MKCRFKLVFENGDVVYVAAQGEAEAIGWYCCRKRMMGKPVDEEWAKEHCEVTVLGPCYPMNFSWVNKIVSGEMYEKE